MNKLKITHGKQTYFNDIYASFIAALRFIFTAPKYVAIKDEIIDLNFVRVSANSHTVRCFLAF